MSDGIEIDFARDAVFSGIGQRADREAVGTGGDFQEVQQPGPAVVVPGVGTGCVGEVGTEEFEVTGRVGARLVEQAGDIVRCIDREIVEFDE